MQRYGVNYEPYYNSTFHALQCNFPQNPPFFLPSAPPIIFDLYPTDFISLIAHSYPSISLSLSQSAMAMRPRSPEIKEIPEDYTSIEKLHSSSSSSLPKPKPPAMKMPLIRQKSAPAAVTSERRSCCMASAATGIGCSSGRFSHLRNLVANPGGCLRSPRASEETQIPPEDTKGKEPATIPIPRRPRGAMAWGTKMAVGERETMEDYFASIISWMKLTCQDLGSCSDPLCDHASKIFPVHYFGVFDGHRGHQVSEYCANVLHHMVVEEWEKQAPPEDVVGWSERWKNAFSRAFERADEHFKARTLEVHFAGSTAVVVVVSPCQIIASNCGDSKAILCRSKEVIPLTFDHKPNRQEEIDRIESIGGKIFWLNGLRVEGVLAMTRAIGDHDLKPFVISTPDVTFTKRSKEDECLVLASDGLWDVMTMDTVGKFAVSRLRSYRSNVTTAMMPAAAVADDLVRMALINNSKDNVTVTVVDLKPLWRMKRSS